METNRTLLPIYEKYVKAFDLEKKEPTEDFSFMPNDSRIDYEMFRRGLDKIPGSREYLKNIASGNSFSDSIGNKIMMNAGDHHSGASVRGLAWTYKQILNDWDGWVLNMKMFAAKKFYEKRQLTREDTWEYDHAVSKKNSLSRIYGHSKKLQELDDAIKVAIENLRTKYFLTYSDAEICELMDDLIHEFNLNSRKDLYERDKREFDDKIELLEHHYVYPARWDDYGSGMLKSALFGSIYGITESMYAEMERRHPGYRQTIQALMNPHHFRCSCGSCHRKRVAHGTDKEYTKWLTVEAEKIFEPRTSQPDSYITTNPINMVEKNRIIEESLFNEGQGVTAKCDHNLPNFICETCAL
jgi:hypothetical protein